MRAQSPGCTPAGSTKRNKFAGLGELLQLAASTGMLHGKFRPANNPPSIAQRRTAGRKIKITGFILIALIAEGGHAPTDKQY